MATVTITHRWADEAVTCVEVAFEDSYPLAMERAMDEALRAMGALVIEDEGDGGA